MGSRRSCRAVVLPSAASLLVVIFLFQGLISSKLPWSTELLLPGTSGADQREWKRAGCGCAVLPTCTCIHAAYLMQRVGV